ncbi:MAG: zinc ribbon domain-containing protein, partial [Candidatus Electrothrix sp. AUS4]|nr:zinc ribbon domain-containing protein [Candidatus Electrothrix sp. AUS4]
ILSNHFLRECPYCAELIKARAKVCKHCSKELG